MTAFQYVTAGVARTRLGWNKTALCDGAIRGKHPVLLTATGWSTRHSMNSCQAIWVWTALQANVSPSGGHCSTNPLISEANILVSGLAVLLSLKTITGPVSFRWKLVPLTVSPQTTNKSRNSFQVVIILRILDKLTVVTTILSCYTLFESFFLC